MAKTTIKSTFSLDAKTIRSLEQLVRRWKTTKSEVLRRVIQAALTKELELDADRVATLTRLQERMQLTETAADEWIADIRAERAHFPRTPRTRK